MLADNDLKGKLEKFWTGKVRWQVPMAEYTTLRVGGPAQALVEPGNRNELIALIAGCREECIPYYLVGGGSNLLVADKGITGLVIVLDRNFGEIRSLGLDSQGRTLVEVEAGCRLSRLLNWSVDNELSGLEFAAGIPGTVGGAVAMNAGAWGGEIKDILVSLTWLNKDQVTKINRQELDFSYRKLKKPEKSVILTAVFAFTPGAVERIKDLCRKYFRERRRKQPTAHGMAGSFFKNPQGAAAGKLIEDAGLKGTRIGGAEVSGLHANFIVNKGNATADDIFRLMSLVQERVWEIFKVRLEPEVKVLD